MQFRWAIGIALWTMLSGPIFAPPPPPRPAQAGPTASRGQAVVVPMQAVQLPLVRR